MTPSRRFADSGSVPFAGTLHQKSRPSPLLSLGLVLPVIVLVFFLAMDTYIFPMFSAIVPWRD